MTAVRALARRVGGLAVVVLGIAFVLPPERSAPWRMFVAGAFAISLVGLRGAVAAGSRPAHPEPHVIDRSGPPEEQVVRLARLEAALGFAVESHRQFDRSIRPMLCRLADERLRAHHGIVLAESPAAARAMMGEELWQLVEDEDASRTHPGPGPAPAQLHRLIAQLQAI